jgi:hypothetical protein
MNTTQPERNPETHAAHRREVFLQIILPILIGSIILLTLVGVIIYAGISGNSQVSRWADISLVWLLLPSIMFALFLLLFLVVLTIGLTRLLHVFPFYAYRLHFLVFKIENKIKKAADMSIEPILKINSFMASARRLLRRS